MVYNWRNYAVMLATPWDLIDFTVGFTLTERIVGSISDILGLDIIHTERAADLRLRIAEHYLERFDLRQRRRNLRGNTGCGVCGLENADKFFEPLPRVANIKTSLNLSAISKAIDALPEHQPINQRTRAAHAAAWVNFDGAILHVREDVGCHNALDKLLGTLVLEGVDIKSGFVFDVERCSYELIEKAAHCSVTALASISSPTSFALRKAAEANLALYVHMATGVDEITG